MLKEQADEFAKFCYKLSSGENFALARFADGERFFIEGKRVTGLDGWTSPDSISKLGQALRDALTVSSESGCYIGISDDTNDTSSKLFYANLLKGVQAEKITLSNVFVNGTYGAFLSHLLPILAQKKLVIVCNYRAKPLELSVPLKTNPYYVYVPKDCYGFWERSSDYWIKQLEDLSLRLTDHVFLFAAGPLSSATIPLLWKKSTSNTYLDIGSALDPFFFDKKTRPYQTRGTLDSGQLASLYIQDDINEGPRDGITCIINCYKRWLGVYDIISALRSQTVRPKEIHVLFNTLPPTHLLQDLRDDPDITNILCSDINLGVWNRFAYALTSKTEYVCIFDDDTVPGSRWLENCLDSMSDQEGLYGTVGLRLFDPECYMNHQRLGWPSPNSEIEEVDLVGHSWFFKRDWLSSYWRDLPPATGFDFMGEDMHMSFAIQKYLGLSTYVPPHPLDDRSLWGSIASQRGVDEHAISMTGKASRMDFAVNRLINLGWKLNFVRSL
jgi:hypothetical protein